MKRADVLTLRLRLLIAGASSLVKWVIKGGFGKLRWALGFLCFGKFIMCFPVDIIKKVRPTLRLLENAKCTRKTPRKGCHETELQTPEREAQERRVKIDAYLQTKY